MSKLYLHSFVSHLDLFLGFDSIHCETEHGSLQSETCFLISREQGLMISNTASRKTQSGFQNTSETNKQTKNDKGNTSFWSTTFTKFCSFFLFFFSKLKLIKFNPKSIQPAFRFSEKGKRKPSGSNSKC